MTAFPTSLRRFAGPAVLVALIICCYWKITLTNQYTWASGNDASFMELPRMQFMARELAQGRFPLWDPHQWYGQPFLGEMTGAANPLNWLALWFAGRHPRISRGDLNWYFALLHLIAALNAYALCRGRRRSQTASVVGGVIFSLGGFVGHTDGPTLLNGAIFAPLAFLFLFRAVEGRRALASAATSGALLGLGWLSGHHEIPLYVTMAAMATWLWFILPRGRPDWRVARLALVAVALLALVSGLQTLPAREFGQRAIRWAGAPEVSRWNDKVPYTVHENFAFTPASMLGIVFSGLSKGESPHIGAGALLLVSFAVLLAWRETPVRVFTLVSLGALLWSMSAMNYFRGVVYALVPFMDKARDPARTIAVFTLGAAPLAAYGMDALLAARDSIWVRNVARVAALFGVTVYAITFARSIPYRGLFDLEGVFAALAALTAAALLAAWRRGNLSSSMLSGALVMIVALEVGHVAQVGMADLSYPDSMGAYRHLQLHDNVAIFLRSLPGPIRVSHVDADLPINFGEWYGIDTSSGYTAGVTENVLRTQRYTERTRNLMAITHTIAKEPNRPKQQMVFERGLSLKVFRNPDAFPRVRVVHQAVVAATRDEVDHLLDEGGPDLSQVAITWEPVKLESCGNAGDATLSRYEPARVVIDARLECGGMVVLADTWFPGWLASVDGRPETIHEVYGALRGIVVPAGDHRVELVYRPRSMIVGAAMTAIGGLLVALFWLFRNPWRSGSTILTGTT